MVEDLAAGVAATLGLQYRSPEGLMVEDLAAGVAATLGAVER